MSSTKPKNKNKNKLPTTTPIAATPAAPATEKKSRPDNAHKQAPHTAPRPTSAASSSSSAARPSLLSSSSLDDDTPLVRDAPRKSTNYAVSTTNSASADTPQPLDETIKDDVLFGNKRGDKADAKKRKAESGGSEKKKKSKGGKEDEAIDLFTGTTVSNTLKHLSEPLSHSSLKPGMLVLGAVRAVNEVDLTVQLPHGLTGYVSMREISDSIATIVDKYIEQGEKAELEAAHGNSKKSEEESAAASAITLPVLSEFIREGQLVNCYILSVGENAKDSASVKHSGTTVSQNKSRRIEISLRASLFNQNLTISSLSEGRTLYGSVQSIQEKGYIVDVGVPMAPLAAGQTPNASNNITAFLPFNQAPAEKLLPAAKRTGREKKGEAPKRKLVVGMPIQTVITKVQSARVLVLSAEPSVVNSAVTRSSSSAPSETGESHADAASALKNTIGFTNVQPGMLVKAQVVSVIGTEEAKRTQARMIGLYVRFLDFFHGVIDNLHSSADASIEGALDSLYHEGQKVTARVLYVNYISKKIALTLLPHIVAFEPFVFPSSIKCGDKIESSIVTKVESKMGMYLRLPVPMEGASKHALKLREDEEAAENTRAKPTKGKKSKKVSTESTEEDSDEQEDEDEDMDGSDSEKDDEAEQPEVDEDGEAKVDVSEEQSVSAWAHISRISDDRITHVPKNFTVGTQTSCRILNFHYLDAMVHVSTQPHILSQTILYYEDVQAGMEVEGEIVSVEEFGVLLKLTPHITALIPALHLSDVKISDPSKKFKVGQKLKARVLYVQEKQKKIICTLKKNLLTSALPKLFDYAAAKVGVISHGFIASIQDYGMIIEFYNKVHGLVETKDLVRTSFLKEGQKPENVFKRGDVHKARVVYCDKKGRMKLSFGLVAAAREEEAATEIDLLAAPGSIVSATVKEVKKDGLLLKLADDEEEEENNKKKKASKDQSKKKEHVVFLPTAHLTDHLSLADALLRTYPVGSKFEKLLVLHKDLALKMPIVSAKPSLISLAAAGDDSSYSIPSSYDALQPGSLLMGFVRATADFGVFIGFLDHVSALVPRNMLADQFIGGDLSSSFPVGQTVRAKIVNVEVRDNASPKVTVSLKPSHLAEAEKASKCEKEVLEQEGQFAASFFRDTNRVAAAQFSSKEGEAAAINWGAFPLSGALNGEIKLIKDFGLVLESAVETQVQGLVLRPFHTNEPASKKELLKKKAASGDEQEIATESGETFTVGQNVKGKILDVDQVKKIVDVSLRPELVASLSITPSAGADKKRKSTAAAPAVAPISVGSWVNVKVQLVRKQYIVVSLPQNGHAIGYALTQSTNARFNPHSVFNPGFETKALVHSTPKSPSDRLLLVLDLHAALNSYSKNKKSGETTTAFIDPEVSKLSELQNGRKLLVEIRGLAKGESISEMNASSKLEVAIGDINGKTLTGLVHMSELEDALHQRAAAGDKEAKNVLKAHAEKPYVPLLAWATKKGEKVTARIMNIVRKEKKDAKNNKAGKSRKLITSVYLSLRPSRLEGADASADDTEAPAIPHLDLAKLKANTVLQAFVKDVDSHAALRDSIIWTTLAPGIKGRIRCNELSFEPKTKVDLRKYKPGQALTVQVLEVHPDVSLVDLVLLPLGTSKAKKFDEDVLSKLRDEYHAAHELKQGSILHDVVIKKVLPDTGLLVAVGPSKQHQKLARIHITDLSDAWKKDPLSTFKVGQKLPRAYVLSVVNKVEEVYRGAQADDDEDMEESKEDAKTQQQIDLSLRASRTSPAGKAAEPKVSELNNFSELVEGSVTHGYVKNTSKAGCFISLNRNIVARCLIKNLSDGYVTNIDRHFPAGKLLTHVKIVKVDAENQTVEVSLRKNDNAKGGNNTNGNNSSKFEDISVGDIVKADVTSIATFGVFLKIHGSNLSGLCHISEVSDTKIDDLTKHYSVGDKVRAKIVKKDDEGRKISFGLKAKYFEGLPEAEDADEDEEEEGDAAQSDDEEQDIEEDEEEEVAPKSKKAVDAKKKKAAKPVAEDDDEEEEVEMDDSAQARKKARKEATAPLAPLPSMADDDAEMTDAPALDLQASYSLLTGANQAQEDSEDELDEDLDEDGPDAAAKKKSRRAKAGAKKAEERELASREHAILDPNAQPESADEFERIIVQNPNASLVWIKFMAYQISLTEIEKARKIAERALKAISFRHPQEKLNVWIALLNLENMYGTQKTMQDAFNRALQYNEPLTIYLEVAKIYAATKKIEQCVETYEGAVKKFGANPKVWSAYASFLYTVPAKVSAARDLLKRALSRLDKSDHIALIVKFASLEFHVAQNVDRGRTLLEGVLSNYPKRVDLWNVYLDMEMKLGAKLSEALASTSVTLSKDVSSAHLDSIRKLFDRVTSLNFSSKKMKFIFQKWLSWEKNSAGAQPDRVEFVKNKARAYVASKSQSQE